MGQGATQEQYHNKPGNRKKVHLTLRRKRRNNFKMVLFLLFLKKLNLCKHNYFQAEEFEKYAVLRNMFRRRSSTEFATGGFKEVVNEKQAGSLLDEMGAHVDKNELHQAVEKMAPDGKRMDESVI